MVSSARRLALVLCVALAGAMGLAPALAPTPARAQAPFSDAKYAAIVIDAQSGEVLYAKRADSQRYPASITKIMTLYLTFEALQSGKLKLTDTVVVSPHAASQAPSKLGLAAGERITVEDAIHAICVKSANDMAVAMAEKLGGTESRFAALMTLKAGELGMSNTRYVNASGLPDSRQLSSARDIAILSRAVLRDFPQYYPYFSTKTWAYRNQTLKNHNGLLFAMPGVDGIKTGFTNASGFNLSASAVRDGHRLITVVMGGPSTRARDSHVEWLLATGFDVLRRRAAGENITVAQNYFEPQGSAAPTVTTTAAGPVQYASIGPSATQALAQSVAPTPTVTASFLPTAAVHARLKPAIAEPARPAKVERASVAAKGKKKKVEDTSYLVQVGSFRQKSEARGWLRETARRFDSKLGDAEAKIITVDGWYRTRFEGLTKDAAGAACKAFKAHRLACMVMRD
jgi:D-alanyl-D-alanine carboxypeptidase (penicillin-binding protein 5/6)